ncbi:hypothetical protein BY996DRAFT_6504917 [Phakopsora pachyrhizi]|nr:hypothetical protein BY996DRAFT_6504917 [Phakopsora pachyrhizi]
MNLLTSGSRSETLESEAHSSQHQSIISQFKQTHSEDYHQNQLLQLPPLSFQRYYYSTIPSSSLYSSEPNYDSSLTLLLPLLDYIFVPVQTSLCLAPEDNKRKDSIGLLLGIPNLGGNSMSSKNPLLISSSASVNGEDEQSDMRLGESLLMLLFPKMEKLVKLELLPGNQPSRDEEDDRIEEHFLRSNCSLSSKKSKSKPIRLTRLFGLLMEDEEEEQQPEGKWFLEELVNRASMTDKETTVTKLVGDRFQKVWSESDESVDGTSPMRGKVDGDDSWVELDAVEVKDKEIKRLRLVLLMVAWFLETVKQLNLLRFDDLEPECSTPTSLFTSFLILIFILILGFKTTELREASIQYTYDSEEELLDPTMDTEDNQVCQQVGHIASLHRSIEETLWIIFAPPNSLTYPSDSSISNPIQPSLTITNQPFDSASYDFISSLALNCRLDESLMHFDHIRFLNLTSLVKLTDSTGYRYSCDYQFLLQESCSRTKEKESLRLMWLAYWMLVENRIQEKKRLN